MLKKLLICQILILWIFISGCSNDKEYISETTNYENQEKVEVTLNETEKVEDNTIEFSELDMQIHDYMMDVWSQYEKKYSITESEAYGFIDASKEFKKSIIEINRIFSLINNKSMNMNLTENEIDALFMRRIVEDYGFKSVGDKWYYKGDIINLGTPLPIPDSMIPKEAEKGKEIIVDIEVDIVVSDIGRVQIIGKTNLPDNMDLMIMIKNNNGYRAQDKVVIKEGQFKSDWFGDSKRIQNRMNTGTYYLEISSPTVSVLEKSVKDILGEGGKNLKGKNVVFDSIYGNTVEYKKQFVIK
jgi:hypothetical protein